jgi:GT2 family glycosyltransferase
MSILSQSQRFDEVLVLENGDCRGECVSHLLDEVSFVRLRDNFGFGQAVNEGFARTTGTFVTTLNPDVVLSRDWLATITRLAKSRPKVGSFSSVAFDEKGRVDGFGDLIAWPGFHWRRLHAAPAKVLEIYPKVTSADSVCAGYATYRREAFLEVGGFFEPFFLYSEDVELGLRLKKKGWGVALTRETSVRHLGGQSSSIRPAGIAQIQARNLMALIYLTRSRTVRALLNPMFSVLGKPGREFARLASTGGFQVHAKTWYASATRLPFRPRFPWRLTSL